MDPCGSAGPSNGLTAVHGASVRLSRLAQGDRSAGQATREAFGLSDFHQDVRRGREIQTLCPTCLCRTVCPLTPSRSAKTAAPSRGGISSCVNNGDCGTRLPVLFRSRAHRGQPGPAREREAVRPAVPSQGRTRWPPDGAPARMSDQSRAMPPATVRPASRRKRPVLPSIRGMQE